MGETLACVAHIMIGRARDNNTRMASELLAHMLTGTAAKYSKAKCSKEEVYDGPSYADCEDYLNDGDNEEEAEQPAPKLIAPDMPVVYAGNFEGFAPEEEAVFDELLPKWNTKVGRWVQQSADHCMQYGLKIRETGTSRGKGIFTTHHIPAGLILCYGFGVLVKPQRGRKRGAGEVDVKPLPPTLYDTDSYAKMDFSKKVKDRNKNVPLYINSDPALLRAVGGGDERPHFAELSARFNHACQPTVKCYFDDVRVGSQATGRSLTLQLLHWKTLVEIEAGDELTFDYGRNFVVSRAKVARMQSPEAYKPCGCGGKGRCPMDRFIPCLN